MTRLAVKLSASMNPRNFTLDSILFGVSGRAVSSWLQDFPLSLLFSFRVACVRFVIRVIISLFYKTDYMRLRRDGIKDGNDRKNKIYRCSASHFHSNTCFTFHFTHTRQSFDSRCCSIRYRRYLRLTLLLTKLQVQGSL